MSDTWITIIPADPTYVPNSDRRSRAETLLRELAPEAKWVESSIDERVQVRLNGEYLERISCPKCETQLAQDVWFEWMSEDYEGNGFRLRKHKLPCCGAELSVDALDYHWPMGFSRFAVTAHNEGIGELSEESTRRFEEVLGCAVMVIRGRM